MGREQGTTIGTDLEKLIINANEPAVVVVFGKVGVGKTSIANEIARRLETVALTSDVFRRELFGYAPYEEFQSAAALWKMITKAGELFRKGSQSVVFDATFSTRKSRENVRRFANKHKKPVFWVEVISDKAEAVTENIDGALVTRKTDSPTEIEQKIVVDNSARSENPPWQIKRLVDQFVTS